MIRRLYDTEKKYKSFGLRLTGDTVGRHSKLLQVQRAAWLKRNSELCNDMSRALLQGRPSCTRRGDFDCSAGEAVVR